MYRKFFHYVLPSMLAFAFSSLYAIVDGFFIGQSIGDQGLAAINIAYPLVALIQATGTGLGMGGAVMVTVSRGKKQKEQEHFFLGNLITILALSSILLFAVLFCFSRSLLSVMGAEGAILDGGVEYLSIIALGALFQIFSTGLIPILRNYGASFLAMGAMIVGFVVNIILDALFVMVFRFGMAGAAWATIIGQAVTVLPCIPFILKKGRTLIRFHFRPKSDVIKQIVKVGISPFGLTLSPNLVLLIMNKFISELGGGTAIAAYAVIEYVAVVNYALLQGIGDGSQPLISLFEAEGSIHLAKKIRNLAFAFALLTSLFTFAGMTLLRHVIPPFFGASQAAAPIITENLPLFGAGGIFLSFCRVSTSYFYAIRENKFAYFMVYGEPVLLFLLLALVFPPLLGMEGVWLCTPVSQMMLAAVAALLLFLHTKRPVFPKDQASSQNKSS